jgi:membrane protein DedA with SNARE-associated domain
MYSLRTGLAAAVGYVGFSYLFTDDDWHVVQSGWFWYFLAVTMVLTYTLSLRRQREG